MSNTVECPYCSFNTDDVICNNKFEKEYLCECCEETFLVMEKVYVLIGGEQKLVKE